MSPAVQQAMFLRLMVAAVVTFGVILIAAYFYLAPLGDKSIRAVVPVVHEFMSAAADNDVIRAHATYSSRALADTSRDDVAQLLSNRAAFDGYKGLQLNTFSLRPGQSDVEPDTASVTGIVTYESRDPAKVQAQLAFEADRWRIDWITITAPQR